ncbi:MAG: response regulator [Hyphomicrobiaceae bacterium TMED74]|nr:MAG: response regulator [Hyphomicrobiaceae bacterium TMED74]
MQIMRARRSIDERASELMPVPYQQLSAIAVVDGDAAVRDSFFPLLEGVGFAVRAYATGTELLKGLPVFDPSVLLMGSQLPDINTTSLLKEINKLHLRVPTIIMANHRFELPKLEDMAPSPAAILLKPVDEAQLFSAIDSAIHGVTHRVDVTR